MEAFTVSLVRVAKLLAAALIVVVLGDYVQAVLTLFYRFSKEPDSAQGHH